MSDLDELDGIAIIGMTCRLPGANDISEYWRKLRAGEECITFFSDEELLAAGVDAALLAEPDYVKAAGVIDAIDQFDASFFGFSPREAETTDPQHRVFLECAWAAIEDAGYNPETYAGAIGVFAGVGQNNYLLENLLTNPDVLKSVGPIQTAIGNNKDFVPTRVSYKLNLKGPSLNIQTACSTSLVATHMACQSLLNGECDMALAGGASITALKKQGYLYQQAGIYSSDGHCKAFDADANGMVGSNGAAVILMKRLDEAVEDGDSIYAIIRGSAINNDGSAKVGLTAPSVEGQSQVIAEALAVADVDPETITYVETHGTGTHLGDPIEVAALTQAFQSMTDKKGYCAIGSVKTNIGHTDAAAGCAGIIKTALSLQHREIPPSLNFENPNPEIDFAHSPFYVNDHLQSWQAGDHPLRAGVSAFGIGGTNAHVILEQAPQAESSSISRPWQLLMLSARSEKALNEASENIHQYLETQPGQSLADIAFTLTVGRKTFEYRRILVCQDLKDASKVLQTRDSGRLVTSRQDQETRPVAFMFSGQGAQYANMAADLYQSESVFREQLDACAEGLLPHIDLDIRTLIFPVEGQEEVATEQLAQTRLTQPVLFAIEYSLAQLWMSWGVQPQAMIGHSIGEYVAACIAEVMTLDAALALVAARGRLMMTVPGDGAMLAVHKPEQELEKYLDDSLSLAAVNAPERCVVSGPTKDIERLEAELQKNDEPCIRLRTSHAFHSSMMDPVVDQFVEVVGKVKLNKPRLPFISCTTGTWITDQEATDPHYWGRHIRQGVRFSDGARELLSAKEHVLLEVGPGTTLTSLAKMQSGMEVPPTVVASTRHPKEKRSDVEVILGALGQLWQAGARIDWSAFYSGQHRKRLHLPGYPFQRRRYWIEPGKHSRDVLEKNTDISQWFYVPSWKRTAIPRYDYTADSQACYLLFTDDVGVGGAMAQHLASNGQQVITVRAGEEFKQLADNAYSIHPGHPCDYDALIKALAEQEAYPDYIAHCWSISKQAYEPGMSSALDEGFFSLINLVQALGKQASNRPTGLTVYTNAAHTVMGDEINHPVKAMVMGPAMVLPHENPDIRTRCVDLPVEFDPASISESLSAELHHTMPDRLVAYRCGQRWLQTVSPEPRESPATALPRKLREEGVYLISGGLGGIGLTLAEYLAKAARAKLVLLGRSLFPDHEQWSHWLSSHDEDDLTSIRIRKLQELEEHGAEIMICSADVADQQQMDRVMQQLKERFGALHGVIHAAGTAEGGMIQLETRESAQSALAPKVQGTEILYAHCKNFNSDFLLLCSSLATLLEGAGAADYCAANAFMDAFAQYCNAVDELPVISVNWDAWQQIGMAASTETSKQLQAERDEILSKGILPQEGMQAFARILDASQAQLLISTQELEERIRQHAFEVMEAIEEDEEEVLSGSEGQDDRPDLGNDYVAPETEVEKAITAIWRKLFGIQQIGIHDNFFQLGGDSLLATQLLNKLNHSYAETKLALSNLFESPTIAGLSEIINQASNIEQGEGRQDIAHQLRQAPTEEQPGLLSQYLQEQLEKALSINHETLAPDTQLDAIGLTERVITELIWLFKRDLKLRIYPHEFKTRTTIMQVAEFVADELQRLESDSNIISDQPVDLAQYLSPVVKPSAEQSSAKNPAMAFLLSAPRSGSTLMRLMLDIHSGLLCPPELGLLGFNYINDWMQESLNLFSADAAMNILQDFTDVDPGQGKTRMNQLVEKNASIQEVYKVLQEYAGSRLLLDKTPGYSLELNTLYRINSWFESPKCIHLVRHPYSVIDSIVRNRMDRLLGEEGPDAYAIAEKIWAQCNRNILELAKSLPDNCYYMVRYEDLVRSPQDTMKQICEFLDIPFEESMTDPYAANRKIAGVGDPDILQHDKVDAKLANTWQDIILPRPLNAISCDLAQGFQYELPREAGRENQSGAESGTLEDVDIDNLSDEEVEAMLRKMMTGEQDVQ